VPISYVGSENFKQSLNTWLSSQTSRAAGQLESNKTQIPNQLRNYTKLLHLAIVVDDTFIDNAYRSRAQLSDYTTWTKDLNIARMTSRGQKLQEGQYKILITKTVPIRDQIIDIDEFVRFMGLPQLAMLGFDSNGLKKIIEHKSVLISNQITITRNDYTIVEQFSNKTTP
jgi:hypothetical protein